MTWFKVDDGLFLHGKIIKAGNAAMGLWLRAGSWSAHHLTDGFIPDAVVEVLGTPAQRSKLIKVGLWIEAEGGCQFHEWAERQPSRSEVRDQRSSWAARKQKSREKSRETSCPSGSIASENLEISEESQVSVVSHAPVTPSRPDPSLTTEEQQTPTGSVARSPRLALAVQPPLLDVVDDPSPSAPAKRTPQGHRLPEDWKPGRETQLWTREFADRVDITSEWSKFQDYWLSKAGAGARKLDWDRTWKNWVRRAAEDAGRRSAPRGAGPSPRAQRLAHSMSIIERLQAQEDAEAQAAPSPLRKAIL